MTGMKEGAGENPFATETDSESDQSESSASSDEDNADSAENEEGKQEASRSVSTTQPMQIPYKFRRDGVQDGRDRVPLFLKEETKDAEREALRELEKRFGDDVSLTDLREALMKVGLDNLDEAESYLEEWGYGMTFEE